VIAPCPAWFKDAHWGKHLECELDLPEAIAKAKALLRDAKPETDHQEKTPRWLKKFEREHDHEWEPKFDETDELAFSVLCEGISIDRAFQLMDQYWNVRNRPPLARTQLRELVEAAYEDRCGEYHELRWRWARDNLQDEKGANSGSMANWLTDEDEPEDFLCGEVLSQAARRCSTHEPGRARRHSVSRWRRRSRRVRISCTGAAPANRGECSTSMGRCRRR
jgi:hypothetical protein